MSIGKRMLFDPRVRQQRQEEARAAIDAHPHRIPTRRKNKAAHGPRWDLYGRRPSAALPPS